MITEIILLVLEIVGTIAFAVSGAFVAIKARFDIFGVLVVGCITAVGGGMTRDILIGSVPPAIFSKLYIVGIAALTSLAVFIIAYINRKKFDEIRERIEHINNIFDAIGLAAFTVMGTELAFTNGIFGNVFLSVTLGVLTGVGGGLLRDILTETSPYIFKKHVYAVAAIFGALLYYVIRRYVGNTVLPSVTAMLFIIGIRLLAAKYRWSLPKVQLNEEKILKFVKDEAKEQENDEEECDRQARS
ncbi:MAG: trimeric intracellular cation channel family protein [Clostridia bacterium]|nr:trimeric intracellular cation channel family protein [Clostridia bacterium]